MRITNLKRVLAYNEYHNIILVHTSSRHIRLAADILVVALINMSNLLHGESTPETDSQLMGEHNPIARVVPEIHAHTTNTHQGKSI